MTRLTDRCSLEITAKDEQSLREARPYLAPGTEVSITFLPTDLLGSCVAAAVAIRHEGLIPIPHLSARRLESAADLETFLTRLSNEAAVDRVFVIAGDSAEPQGPFADALAIIQSGSLARHGMGRVGIAGYPEGHPTIPHDKLWQALKSKQEALAAQNHSCEIVTQFSFDADAILIWLKRLRDEGILTPVKIGIPGPASVRSLLRYAARCGVGASSKVMAKYGLSLSKLLSPAGPDALVAELEAHLHPSIHGEVSTHLYPFGGIQRAVEWVHQYHEIGRAG